MAEDLTLHFLLPQLDSAQLLQHYSVGTITADSQVISFAIRTMCAAHDLGCYIVSFARV